MPTPYLLTPHPYRNLALFTAVVGTLLLWRYAQAQGMAAFAAVVFLFAGALVAIVAVILALRQRDSGMVIQNLLLMLWQIGFPLAWMAKLYHQAV
ncbi:hypothetical protein [Neisseria animaloris]|uniref:hypothetical protein n=1 Tax=Neisseria animaloris TaxID=326522 RepID=UPI000D38F30E|nr:hypothetical protein [Neisseria animaloris]